MSQCSLCESMNVAEVYTAQGLHYLLCNKCGLEKQNIGNDALKESFEKSQMLYYEEDDLSFSKPIRAINLRKAKKRIKVVKEYLNSGRLLEIGPGCGEFLTEAVSAGFDIEAIETSKRFADYINKTLKIKTYEVMLEDFNHEGGKYDAVYSSHVIEHVVDPIFYLLMAKKTVREGGYFFIMSPNADCWEHRVTGKSWSIYSTAHLHLFTPKSLTLCLEKAGWEVVGVRTFEFAEDWIKALHSLFFNRKPASVSTPGARIRKLPGWLALAVMGISRFVLLPLSFIQSIKKKGGDIFIVARHPSDGV